MIPRILIVDDEAPARARLQTLLQDIAAECPHRLVGSVDKAQAALEAIAQQQPDIVLLDIQMPGISGIELAMQLKSQQAAAPAIVFITAYDAYALEAFGVHAFDYLLKPVRASRLADAIRRIAALRAAVAPVQTEHEQTGPGSRRHLSVQARDKLILVPISDVLYLKAELKYVTVRTASQEYLIEESLASLESEWASHFIRIHRNALVARDAIAGVEKGGAGIDGEHAQESWQVILRGIDDRLPISRRQWSAVKALVK